MEMKGKAFGAESLERFLDRLASAEPAPSGGGAAAVTAAMAAGLVAMAARLSGGPVDDADAIAATADELRRRALALADDDAVAYAGVLAAYRLPRQDPAGEDPGGGPGERSRAIRAALEAATAVPLAVAEVAAEAAVLGGRLVETGNPDLVGDANAAVELGRAAARAAARLVEINVRQGGLDGDWAALAAAEVARAESPTPGVFDHHISPGEV